MICQIVETLLGVSVLVQVEKKPRRRQLPTLLSLESCLRTGQSARQQVVADRINTPYLKYVVIACVGESVRVTLRVTRATEW